MLAAITPAILAGTGATGASLAAAIGSVDRAVAGLPPHLQDEIRQLLALLASWPGRRWVAGVGAPWRDASVAEVCRVPRALALQPLGAAAAGLSRAPRPRPRRVVRAAGQLGGDRLSRAARGRVIRDPIREGLAAGWKVTDAAALDRDLALEADVAIVGTGAGGGVTAEILAAAGLEVVLVEEGALRSSSDFHMLEAEAYPQLYQESAARKTLDKAITILQGRCVGGSTTVNWTSSFRTPDSTLAYWRERFGLTDVSPAALAPWFERMEERLAIRAVDRAAEREQRAPRPRRGEARHRHRRHPAQRQRLLEHRLLRTRLPDEREAVDARDDDPGGARPRRPARLRGARRPARARAGPGRASGVRRRSIPGASGRPARGSASGPDTTYWLPGRSGRPPCSSGAGRPTPIGRSAGARSFTPR